MQLNRFKKVEEFKAAFPKQLEQLDFSNLEQQILSSGGRLAVAVVDGNIVSIFAEIHPNPMVTVLSCVANFAPVIEHDVFVQYNQEHKLGFVLVDVPTWLKVEGVTPLSVICRSPKATLGYPLNQFDITDKQNLRKRLREVRNSTQPYDYQIQMIGCTPEQIENGRAHLAALSYEPVRHQYAIN
ncbi:hypothetical protein pEaSNUABM11_00201 [Erwinia phage pEa_SNUABM_11]|nr:hypothetical protein pEaSNUABM11_00201 [Erwinia phage pEa_SNUABM_11]